MLKHKILLTGGSGLLGTELQKINNHPEVEIYAPSHKEFDITAPIMPNYRPDIVIHAAAYTDLIGAERDRELCNKINVDGTINLVRMFPFVYFVYISTEYVTHPFLNYYSYTKAVAEDVVKEHISHLIIRTLFKPRPFPHKRAFVDQYTRGDYVDVIAPLIFERILALDTGIANVGTGRKTIYELARQSNPEVGKMSLSEVSEVRLPHDYI